jgi:hypothetical protein
MLVNRVLCRTLSDRKYYGISALIIGLTPSIGMVKNLKIMIVLIFWICIY